MTKQLIGSVAERPDYLERVRRATSGWVRAFVTYKRGAVFAAIAKVDEAERALAVAKDAHRLAVVEFDNLRESALEHEFVDEAGLDLRSDERNLDSGFREIAYRQKVEDASRRLHPIGDKDAAYIEAIIPD